MTDQPAEMRARLRITCADATTLLTDYDEDALSPSDERRIAAHLDGCQACSAFLDQLRATTAALASLRSADIPPAHEPPVERLTQMFRQAQGRPPHPDQN